jgi:peptidoglycan/xylan/chitin deacetylase (PgdA/CDA1 family)
VTGVIPVLLYHSVADHPTRDRRYTVSRADFEEHADLIGQSGRVALLVSDLAAALRGERVLPDRPMAVTFDDGFADTYDAIEVLLRRDVPATVYITTGEVGTADRMSRTQVADLARRAGVEVGAHAVRHRRLDVLGEHDLAYEVRGSKAQLEELTQVDVESFAYPHGAYDRRAREHVIAAGYRSAAAVKNAVSHAADDPFAIARWMVTAGTPAARIGEIIEGANVPRAWAHERLRTRAYRHVRRSSQRLAKTLEVIR